MSHEQPILRVLRQVTIPEEVIADLQAVNEAIQRGEDFTKIPTDDYIQIGCLCGGLMDDDSGRFYFSVHLKDNLPYIWDIALSPTQIEQISERRTGTLDLWCCPNPVCGFKTYIENIACHWCDYGGDRTRR